MPRYKVSFEYETEVEADDEHDAILQVGEMWDCGHIGSCAIAEEVDTERKCPDCGQTADVETGFIFKDELYCFECCPDGYGE